MIALMYRSFGAEPPHGLTPAQEAVLGFLAVLFVGLSLVATVLVNVFTLCLGVLVTFLGHDGARFNFVQLFGRLPLIGITVPVLLGFGIWHGAQRMGWSAALWPPVLTLLLAVILLALTIVVNTMLKDRRG
jgi:4-hydroxybenzoate polyprenyltransferase